MTKSAPAKHKIRVATRCGGGWVAIWALWACLQPATSFAKHKPNCSMAPQKWPKCDASKWSDGQMRTVKAPPFYLHQHWHFRPPFVRRRRRRRHPPFLTFLSSLQRAKSCKLMATGAHSKRFHYCHKLRRLRRLRLAEIALKNFPAVLFDFRYVIFKWLPKSRAPPQSYSASSSSFSSCTAGSNKMRWQLFCWRALISSLDRITIPCRRLERVA